MNFASNIHRLLFEFISSSFFVFECEVDVVLIFKGDAMLSCCTWFNIFKSSWKYKMNIIIIWMSIGMDQINYLFICRCCVCWMLNFSSSLKIWIINKRFMMFKNVSHLQLLQQIFMTCCMLHASCYSPVLTNFQLPQFKPLLGREQKREEETPTEINESNLSL